MVSRKYCLAAILCLVLTCVEGVKVSETACTDGGSQCSSLTGSTCVNSKCTCSTGYAENTSDGRTCVQLVSATTCSSGGNECKTIANSACEGNKCKCNAGFSEATNTCVKGSSASTTRIAVGTMAGLMFLSLCFRRLFV